MIRRVFAVVLVLLASAAGGAPASANPDPKKLRADVEALARWFQAPETDAVRDPSPTLLLNRLLAARDAALRPVLAEGDEAARYGYDTLEPELLAVTSALYDMPVPECDRWRGCRVDVVLGAAVPVEVRFEGAVDNDGPPLFESWLRGKALRPKPFVVKPLEVFAAIDKGTMTPLDARRSVAFGVALGEACLRADGNVAELLRRARAEPTKPFYLHALAALGRPDAAAFLAERLAAEAERASKSPEADALVAAAFHALRRADAKRCDATVGSLPPAAQDAVFVSIGRQLALPALWAAYRAAPDDASRASLLRRAMAVLSAKAAPGTGWKPFGDAAEAATRLAAAALGSADAPTREACATVCGETLGVGWRESEHHEIVPKGMEEEPHTPRRLIGRDDVGPSASAEWMLRTYLRGLDAGEFVMRPVIQPRLFGPKPPDVPTLELRRTLRTAVAPPAGFEPDAVATVGPLALNGEWSADGLTLTLTNAGPAPVSVSPALLGFVRLSALDVLIPPGAAKPSYRVLEVRLGSRWGPFALTAVASRLRVLAAGESYSWTVAVPPEHRSADHVSVDYWEEGSAEGTVPAPWLTYFTPAWVR